MTRYDVKLVFTQEFTFAEEAEDPLQAQAQALAMFSLAPEEQRKPEQTDVQVAVSRGVA